MCDGHEIKAEDITFTKVKGNTYQVTEEKTLREYTCDIIEYYLKKHNKNVVLVAEKLDIGKSKIYNMIQSKEINV
jgi:transcriptional regulator with PAS, ATPase and Fis domain